MCASCLRHTRTHPIGCAVEGVAWTIVLKSSVEKADRRVFVAVRLQTEVFLSYSTGESLADVMNVLCHSHRDLFCVIHQQPMQSHLRMIGLDHMNECSITVCCVGVVMVEVFLMFAQIYSFKPIDL